MLAMRVTASGDEGQRDYAVVNAEPATQQAPAAMANESIATRPWSVIHDKVTFVSWRANAYTVAPSHETRVLSAQSGTGATGALASWATEGDLPGVAASSCVPTQLQQRFLVPATTTGKLQVADTRLELRVAEGLGVSQPHLRWAVLHDLLGADRLAHLNIGDLRRVRAHAFDRQHGQSHLLANSDDDAIATLSDLGFGGIYVVTGASGDGSTAPR